MSFILTSSAFAHHQRIPRKFTCQGDDISPALDWTGTPTGTRSFALICSDPDAPSGTWYHWGLYNIPPDLTQLEQGIPKTPEVGRIRQAVSDFRKPGYGGPCPPMGHGDHRYQFRLFALDIERLSLSGRVGCRDLETSIKGHVLAEAQLTGHYSR